MKVTFSKAVSFLCSVSDSKCVSFQLVQIWFHMNNLSKRAEVFQDEENMRVRGGINKC